LHGDGKKEVAGDEKRNMYIYIKAIHLHSPISFFLFFLLAKNKTSRRLLYTGIGKQMATA
jgi:hypothetical protein